MLDPDLRSLISQVSWESKRNTKTSIAGRFQRRSRGKGLDFHEVRPYQFGDDVRYIDWNVTSRTGDLQIKEFETEENYSVLIFLDISHSMKSQKRRSAFQIALFLTLLHLKESNSVRLVFFSDSVKHISKKIRRDEDAFFEIQKFWKTPSHSKEEKTNFTKVFEKIFPMFSSLQITYWISDFSGFNGFYPHQRPVQNWEQFGVWVDFPEVEEPLPIYFKIFSLFHSEGETSLSWKSNFKSEKEAFESTFRKNQFFIDPSKKLRNQILQLFPSQ